VTRTRFSTVALLAFVGAAVGWALEAVLVAMGRAIVIPPVTLSVALVLIAAIVIAMAVPVWRVVRGTATKRVDPFYATRVVVLAKASSLAGSLLAGAAIAIMIFVLTRSVLPALGSVGLTVAASVCAVLLLVAGLIAEKMCTLPPQDEAPDSQRTPKEST
jgi:hypothetical protein